MGREIQLLAGGVADMHNLSRYVFDYREAATERECNTSDSADRLQSKLICRYIGHGFRMCVAGVLLVELFDAPHVLLLQERNSFFKLPGGKLLPGEADIDGLKRNLSSELSPNLSTLDDDWQIGEYLGICWSDFDLSTEPHSSSPSQIPEGGTKIFLVRLPKNRKFVVPSNLKILAIPLERIEECPKVYGPVVSMIPNLLLGFYLNKVGM